MQEPVAEVGALLVGFEDEVGWLGVSLGELDVEAPLDECVVVLGDDV